MKHNKFIRIIVAITAGLMLWSTPAWSGAEGQWAVTWSAAPDQAGPALHNATVRQIVRTSVGGSTVRIRLSNLYGTGPLNIAQTHLAVHTSGSGIRVGSDHLLTFAGKSALMIPRGTSALSDPLDMAVGPLQELVVSLYLQAESGPSTMHGVGMQSSYIQRGRDASAATTLPDAKVVGSRYFLTDVEISGTDGASTIVVIGDSITDGVGSTLDANGRWPDVLAARLQTNGMLFAIGVANEGIAGNRILKGADDPFRGASVLARFDRDVLAKPGVKWVILDAGKNDIGASGVLGTARAQASAQQIIGGMQQLIALAHAKNIKIIGTTLTPFSGVDFGTADRPYYSAAGETKRQQINNWMRTSGAFDGVIDADVALRDPANPNALLSKFDSDDHLHPNDAGHKAIADAIDLRLFSAAVKSAARNNHD